MPFSLKYRLLFFFQSKSPTLKSFLSWVSEVTLCTVLYWRESASLFVKFGSSSYPRRLAQPSTMALKNKILPQEESLHSAELSILDLPELTLEFILEKLPPAGLCTMAEVCRSLKDRCRSDYLWEKHLKKKWGRVLGDAAYREWKRLSELRKDYKALDVNTNKRLVPSLSCVCPVSLLCLKMDRWKAKQGKGLPVDSIMSWYLSLESGKFWFPAQVYNRENGHVGFMLSCYDAELSYDKGTETFFARYQPHGNRTMVMEEAVHWNRLRAPPVDTPAHELHISDCLNSLSPGDHFEIQWRRNKEFPYGWWYGVVGHLNSCNRNENICHCQDNDIVVLEFNHYSPGSRWRQAIISRKQHREEGNETDGFYGGIRKLLNEEEIAVWRQLWPDKVLG